MQLQSNETFFFDFQRTEGWCGEIGFNECGWASQTGLRVLLQQNAHFDKCLLTVNFVVRLTIDNYKIE